MGVQALVPAAIANAPEEELKKMSAAQLAALVVAMRSEKSVAKLGDGDVFVRRGPDGEVQAVQATIVLRQEKKHFHTIQGNTTISARGYDYMNRIAGFVVVVPPHLELPDGGKVPNPYLHKEKGETKGVWVKCIAVGRNAMGNLVAFLSALYFDIDNYANEGLLKKIKSTPDFARVALEAAITEDDHKKFYFRPLMPGLMFAINNTHADFVAWLQDVNGLVKTAERRAMTICRRNALKQAFGESDVRPQNGIAAVQVIGWKNDFTYRDLKQLGERIDSGEIGDEPITVETIEATTADDDTAAAMHAEDAADDYDDDDAPATDANEEHAEGGATEREPGDDGAEEFKAPFDPEMTIKQRSDVLASLYGVERVKTAMADFPPIGEMTRTEKIKMLDAVAARLAKGGA